MSVPIQNTYYGTYDHWEREAAVRNARQNRVHDKAMKTPEMKKNLIPLGAFPKITKSDFKKKIVEKNRLKKPSKKLAPLMQLAKKQAQKQFLLRLS